MEKTIDTMIKHPFATTMVITCIARSIAIVITAARGKAIWPSITVTKKGNEVVNNG